MRIYSIVILIGLVSGCSEAQTTNGALEQRFEPKRPQFLVDYAETRRFTRGKPTSIKVTPDGDAVLFLRSPARSPVRDLYMMDTATGQTRVLLTADKILEGNREALSADELARRERMRMTARGIAAYQLSKDGRRILVPLSGRLFVIERSTGAVRELPDEGGFPLDPQFSPDGEQVACVRDGDLYVCNVESGEQRRLTQSDDPNVTNGVSEFVAQEEMGRFHGYWWSPDSRRIVYQQTDTSPVEKLYIADAMNPAVAPHAWPYPRPGRNNAVVRLGIIPAAGGETTWIEWDHKQYEYLATVRWQKDAPLTLVVQNRNQTELAILTADADSGATSVIHVETDQAWINLDQSMPYWLTSRGTFLWTTERYGEWALEERRPGDKDATVIMPAGVGNFRGLVSVSEDDQEIVALTDTTSPVQRRESDSETSSKPAANQRIWHPTHRSLAVVRMTPQTGKWSRPHVLSNDPGPKGRTMLGAASAVYNEAHGGSVRWLHAPKTDCHGRVQRRDGTLLGELPSVAEKPDEKLNVEFLTVEKNRTYYCAVIRPRDFDPKRSYPVLDSAYAGPGFPVVNVSGARLHLDQWYADQGFIVVKIDGRGTPNRGRSWERAIKGSIIALPLEDHVSVLAELGKRFKQMDMSRVGVFGWSFGGYFSAMAVMQKPDVYRAGVAGAPVADWLDYDTHYTERYLALPSDNPDGYRYSSVLTHAPNLRRPLMIIHGTTDDNVYFTHSLKISDTLFRAGIRHAFLPLSNFTHMVADPQVTVRLNGAIASFLCDHLKACKREQS